MRTITYREAIAEGLLQAMELDPNVFVMGIGVDYPSGIFGTTTEPAKRFAPHRVFDTPACENALTGIALGAAAMGKRPVVVHARNDFMLLGFDQMINLAAKWRYMFGGATSAPIVVRGIIGKGWGQGATHSQSLQSVLGHFPGLCVVMPASPCDAKGLMLSALQHSAPVVILEHRALYDTIGEVPLEPVPEPIGKARVVREGNDLTIVATSYMVVEALCAAEALAAQGFSVEVVDPRSIRPLDEETILASIRKTGRLVVADTTWKLYGFASEVAALAAEQAFSHLKAPVARVTVADCPAPVSQPLEQAFYPDANSVVTAALRVFGESKNTISIDREDKFVGPY
jgi:pyruvate dehydrogenase E1 component beta subunit